MKEKVNEAAVLLSRMLNGTLNQDWRGVERAAKELKNIFVMTDRHEFESDKDGTFESACQESSLNQIGKALALLGNKASSTRWSNKDKYDFLIFLDNISDEAVAAASPPDEEE